VSAPDAGDRCTVTLSASREGNAIADLLADRPDITVTRFPAMIRVEGGRLVEFDLGEIAERLGQPAFSAYDLQVELSSSAGRLVAFDDVVLLFARPEDAAEHLGLEAQDGGLDRQG
jgi:propane monooxygenase coupling protein